MAEKHCTSCKTQNTAQVPLAAKECEATRAHNIIKRLIWVIVLLVVLLVGSNLAWTIYGAQFEEVVTTTVEDFEIVQDTEHGTNNCIVNGGEICNG